MLCLLLKTFSNNKNQLTGTGMTYANTRILRARRHVVTTCECIVLLYIDLRLYWELSAIQTM